MAELEISQYDATVLYEDNHGTLLMANAWQPTSHTHHMDIKHFTILQWVERDILILFDIPTHDNYADAFTKPLGHQLFYHHFDTIMGRWEQCNIFVF